jgi:26S proteasome regulatory subunit N2
MITFLLKHVQKKKKAKGIDQYISIRQGSDTLNRKEVDPRLEQVVQKMFDKCFQAGQYKQTIGIALEARRLDIVEKCIVQKPTELLPYVLTTSSNLILNHEFRHQVLRLLVKIFNVQKEIDHISIARCLVDLNDTTTCVNLLKGLLEKSDEQSLLMAYQIGFDLEENASQEYLLKVMEHFGTEKVETDMEVDEVKILHS